MTARHWSERYVGQPYVKDELDCGGWAERILDEQFGRVVSLPKERAQGLRERSRQVAGHIGEFVRPTALPAEGDCVLMLSRGDLWHIGIYTRINAEPHVVHALEGFGSVVCDRIRSLADKGLKLEGFYSWI